ncbi:MAG: cytochrome c maturation protein CcmE [Litorivicinus sp.]
MKPARKQKLGLIALGLVGLSVAVGLTLYALSNNINLFYPPAKVVAGEAPEGTTIRVGGMVVDDSVIRDPESLKVSFQVTDYAEKVTIKYEGILPDLFREGQGIVAEGQLQNGVLMADIVLAKHDEQYMPPEIAESLQMPKTEAEVSY